MIELGSSSVDDTRSIAGAIATLARAADIVLLVGEMGTGKTAFAQGFAVGLGVTERVTSPTFTLLRTYQSTGRARLALNHLDVYRLDQMSEFAELGISELIEGRTVTLIEWGDAVTAGLPADYLEVAIGFGASDDERLVEIDVVGASWATRWRTLGEALEAWTC